MMSLLYWLDPEHALSVPIPSVCPECKTEFDSLYGWAPEIKAGALEAGLTDMPVLKQACWNCGFHHAAYVRASMVYVNE